MSMQLQRSQELTATIHGLIPYLQNPVTVAPYIQSIRYLKSRRGDFTCFHMTFLGHRGYLWCSAGSLAEAFSTYMMADSLLECDHRVGLIINSDETIVWKDCDPIPNDELAIRIELSWCVLVTAMREVLGNHWSPTAITLPQGVRSFGFKALCNQVSFTPRKRTELIFPTAVLTEKMPSAHALTHRRLLAELPLTPRVESIIRDTPEGVLPTLSYIADKVAMGESSLRRKLRQEGTSFRRLRNDWLNHRATLMRSQHFTHSEIAARLGFSATSAYFRALRNINTRA